MALMSRAHGAKVDQLACLLLGPSSSCGSYVRPSTALRSWRNGQRLLHGVTPPDEGDLVRSKLALFGPKREETEPKWPGFLSERRRWVSAEQPIRPGQRLWRKPSGATSGATHTNIHDQRRTIGACRTGATTSRFGVSPACSTDRYRSLGTAIGPLRQPDTFAAYGAAHATLRQCEAERAEGLGLAECPAHHFTGDERGCPKRSWLRPSTSVTPGCPKPVRP